MNSPLKLYRQILRAHRLLPNEFRLIGDMYVKQEFRLFKAVTNPDQLSAFNTEWNTYLKTLYLQLGAETQSQHGETASFSDKSDTLGSANQGSLKLGKNLDDEIIQTISHDRAEQLLELNEAVSSVYKNSE
ncbi:Succinate dehydrogenase assembly factor 3, mitochondrial [Zancudomyces culisetae]|uniref:Succinate dehydrogenase assembly factor 3 n=1 Tax=Zancudomyces culisetae TaxID=1213189 RepID=A0A1R1PVL8_ZANCU|nr:Succinate dehydrogenase assembly factor 3, mitochondrial [Zancudomyces culisetae]|eukprot:OMH85010.1 Succinate dehydrogenase assembly factor 3, mitochondrial [Zancudomyces culisetae]